MKLKIKKSLEEKSDWKTGEGKVDKINYKSSVFIDEGKWGKKSSCVLHIKEKKKHMFVLGKIE